jgi:hypothetical protein
MLRGSEISARPLLHECGQRAHIKLSTRPMSHDMFIRMADSEADGQKALPADVDGSAAGEGGDVGSTYGPL